MEIWMDATSIRDARFVSAVYEGLKDEFNFFITCQRHRELSAIFKFYDVKYKSAGKIESYSMEGRLDSYWRRVQALNRCMMRLRRKPELLISFPSEACTISYMLDIPFVVLTDHSAHPIVLKSIIPLSDKILVPLAIGRNRLIQYGASPENIRYFRGVFEATWIKRHRYSADILRKLDVRGGEYAVFRPTAVQNLDSTALHVLERITSYWSDGIIAIIRSKSQRKEIKKLYADRVKIINFNHDVLSLLKAAAFVVSGGFLMAREASLMGVPSILYSKPSDVERFLIERGFPLYTVKDSGEVSNWIVNVAKDPERYKINTSNLLEEFEDPIEILIDEIAVHRQF